jgi:hypothetical protein
MKTINLNITERDFNNLICTIKKYKKIDTSTSWYEEFLNKIKELGDK